MTKKHFIALADHLRGAELSKDVLDRLCRFMRDQNPQFKEERWRAYLKGDCGPTGGKVRVQDDRVV